MEEEIIKITPDRERAKSILDMVKLREKRIENDNKEEFSTLLLEDYYEIVKELATALMNLDGFKTLSHKTLFEYLANKYEHFTLEETELMSDLRRTRNKVVYEGFFIKPTYLKRNEVIIRQIIIKLRKRINEKLMPIENFFLRYAYPCAYIIMQRGELTIKQLQELEDIAIKNKPITKEKLEKIFHRAFFYINKLAKKRNKTRWDPEIIKEYFYSYHNEVIEKGEGSYATATEMLKELSKVDKAIIKEKKDDILTVEFNNKVRNVLDHFIPEAKVGDKVTIHYGYAIEILAE
jgi:hydrogenase maturation factor